MATDRYELVLGLPHTNHLGLAEHLLLMQAGHFQWSSIAKAIGAPLSSLRTASGQEVYATFYFVEERFPDAALPNTFHLDDRLVFAVSLRSFKGIAIEAQIVFDREPCDDAFATDAKVRSDAALRHPYIRLANIFITPEAGNQRLKVASPVGAEFTAIPKLPSTENPYQITTEAQHTRDLGLLNGWRQVDDGDGVAAVTDIDIDRDTNGAGLVYFANYVVFMDRAERAAMRASVGRAFTDREITGRVVKHRRIAYYGNVSTFDRVHTQVRTLQHDQRPSAIGFRYEMRREQDGQLICLSESIKCLPGEP